MQPHGIAGAEEVLSSSTRGFARTLLNLILLRCSDFSPRCVTLCLRAWRHGLPHVLRGGARFPQAARWILMKYIFVVTTRLDSGVTLAPGPSKPNPEATVWPRVRVLARQLPPKHTVLRHPPEQLRPRFRIATALLPITSTTLPGRHVLNREARWRHSRPPQDICQAKLQFEPASSPVTRTPPTLPIPRFLATSSPGPPGILAGVPARPSSCWFRPVGANC